MPLIRISLNKQPVPDFGKKVGDCVHRAMCETLKVPDGDRFQIITEHNGDIVFDPHFLGIERTNGIIIIQMTIAAGRTVDTKAALYKRITELLASELKVRPQDVFINLVEVARENWSFGNGEAQFAYAAPAHLQGVAS